MIKGYNIVSCNKCGFVFVSNPPNENILKEFYQDFDYHSPELAHKRIVNDSRYGLRYLAEIITKRINLIDVGCGRGYFIIEAKKYGWITKGIDFSRKTVSIATRIFGLDVIKSDILTYNTNKKYQLVSLNHIIEHFSSPRAVIRKCKKLIDKNGYIYITTPNIDSLSAKLHKFNFDHFIPPEHLSFFSRNTLSQLLESEGIKVISVRTWSYPEDFSGIIKLLIKGNKLHDNLTNNMHDTRNLDKDNFVKKIKYYILDRIISNLFYRLLSINELGIILEVIGVNK